MVIISFREKLNLADNSHLISIDMVKGEVLVLFKAAVHYSAAVSVAVTHMHSLDTAVPSLAVQ